MKRILPLIVLCIYIYIPYGFSQAEKTRVAVYVTGDLDKKYQSILAGNLTEAFTVNDKYIAVNRSDVLNALLDKAVDRMDNGRIDYSQAVNATKQYGETQLCAVDVVKIDYTYVFRATLLDVESNTVIKTASEATESSISYNTIRDISQKLISRLMPEVMIPNPPNKQKNKKNDYSGGYIAWGIAGAGYPWNLTTSFNFRYGGIVGFGLYADLGLDFTHVNVKCGQYSDFSYTTVTTFHYAGGIKFYPYRGINIGCGYGSVHTPKINTTYYYYGSFDSDDAKVVRQSLQNEVKSHGLLVHGGYDLAYNMFYLGFNAGASFDFNHKVIAPFANIKIGVAFYY